MSAIEGATVRIKTMADGTLQLTINIEPADAIRAFTLFGAPGTPVALAALKVGHALKSDAPAEPKGGPLSQWLAQRCNEVAFREWVQHASTELEIHDSDGASAAVCEAIGVTRKREIDGNEQASLNLKAWIIKPYADWLKKQGAA